MKVLMCKPIHFGIEYEINPWMHVENQVNREKALKQWQKVYDTYKKLGVKVVLLKHIKGLPDMAFPANGGTVLDNTFIAGNFRYKERKGEELYYEKWFAQHGYTIKKLQHYQGGEGDALFFRNTMYAGYGFRSQLAAHKEMKDIFHVPVVSLRLVNPYFYDFDTAFCPIGDKAILYYPEAFDKKSQNILKKIDCAIPMTKNQAEAFIGNSVYVQDKLLVSYLDDDLKKTLKKIDVTPLYINMSEFKKSGGGIKCVTLYLER